MGFCTKTVYLILLVLFYWQQGKANASSAASISGANQGTTLRYDFDLVDFPLEALSSPEVKKHIQGYLGPGRKATEVMLGRATYYFPLFDDYLAANNMPQVLRYLPVVESRLSPRAVSYAGASGLWQFMPATARAYDLRIDSTYDERNDPEASTRAAVAFLQDLYGEFCDWYLALAAYNCGPAQVSRAIRQTGSVDFAKIQPLLPRQTRQYIARYIAAAYLLSFYELHGLEPYLPEYLQKPFVKQTIYQKLDLKDFAAFCGIDEAVLLQLNPQYITNRIPASAKGRTLLLPIANIDDLHRYQLKKPLQAATRQPEFACYEMRNYQLAVQFLMPQPAGSKPVLPQGEKHLDTPDACLFRKTWREI